MVQQLQIHQIYWPIVQNWTKLIYKIITFGPYFIVSGYMCWSRFNDLSVSRLQQPTLMHLNPLNPNYLNQMNFQQKPTKRPKSRPKQITKPIALSTPNNPINHESIIIDDSSNSLTAKFPLQNYLNTSNLQFTYEGYLFAYLRKETLISGRSLLMFPQGIVANCNVINRKLTGWIVVCKKGQFYNISHFFGGKFDGDQYTYDIKCSLMVQSRYTSGKLQSVKRGIANNHISFEKCLKNKELVQLLNQTLDYKFYEDYLPKIQSKLGNYYGSKTKGMPFGLGVLVTDKEYFYGNFQYGLLSGNGVMVFPNGNSYIGQFSEGIMYGYGNYITNGNSVFKLDYQIISQQYYKSEKDLKSFDQNEELSTIFGPIVHFYLKLKIIYQNRRLQDAQESQSFVDVKVQEKNEQPQDKQDVSSGNYTPRQDIISELINTKDSRQRQPGTPHHRQQVNKPENSKETYKIKQDKKDKGRNPNNNEGKPEPTRKSKKQKWIVRNDKDWDEMIEELGDQNVSKQDDFLNPQQDKAIADEPQPLKKNPINARVNPHSATKITDSSPEAVDRLQNNLIKKLTAKK